MAGAPFRGLRVCSIGCQIGLLPRFPAVDEQRPEALDFFRCVRNEAFQMSPDRPWPAGIPGSASDDVNVQLRHQVADPGDVDPGIAQGARQMFGDVPAVVQHGLALRGRQHEKIGQIRLGHQDQPGQGGIALQ